MDGLIVMNWEGKLAMVVTSMFDQSVDCVWKIELIFGEGLGSVICCIREMCDLCEAVSDVRLKVW